MTNEVRLFPIFDSYVDKVICPYCNMDQGDTMKKNLFKLHKLNIDNGIKDVYEVECVECRKIFVAKIKLTMWVKTFKRQPGSI